MLSRAATVHVAGHLTHSQLDDLVDVQSGDIPHEIHCGTVAVAQQRAEGGRVQAVEAQVSPSRVVALIPALRSDSSPVALASESVRSFGVIS